MWTGSRAAVCRSSSARCWTRTGSATTTAISGPLIRLVVSRELDQAFEWTVHEPVALREKLEPAIIDVIRHRKALSGVPEKEAAMIQLGREFFQQHKVSSETYGRALKALGEKNLIDMCVLMGDYTETAVLLTVNDVHLPYDVPSLMPVP